MAKERRADGRPRNVPLFDYYELSRGKRTKFFYYARPLCPLAGQWSQECDRVVSPTKETVTTSSSRIVMV